MISHRLYDNIAISMIIHRLYDNIAISMIIRQLYDNICRKLDMLSLMSPKYIMGGVLIEEEILGMG